MTSIFIDGKEGTTGLRIYDRLASMNKYDIITLDDSERKDLKKRESAINSADIVFLCLPDVAAQEAVGMVKNDKTVVIDTSTAHRTAPGWTYGFPELYENGNEIIRKSKRISVPGCHASGFIALVRPLIMNDVIDKETLLSCISITGYSGGGKKMIAEYESKERKTELDAPRLYGLSQQHKHLPEMRKVTGLSNDPVFMPIVSDYYSGMEVIVPLFSNQIKGYKPEDLKSLYIEKYKGPVVKYIDKNENGFMSSNFLSGYDSMIITVTGNDTKVLLTARYDNLGKGASGAAIQCMNAVLGNKETDGLNIYQEG